MFSRLLSERSRLITFRISAQRNRRLKDITTRETELNVREERVKAMEIELDARKDNLEFIQATCKELFET